MNDPVSTQRNLPPRAIRTRDLSVASLLFRTNRETP
jgi:hypothetical protein